MPSQLGGTSTYAAKWNEGKFAGNKCKPWRNHDVFERAIKSMRRVWKSVVPIGRAGRLLQQMRRAAQGFSGDREPQAMRKEAWLQKS